MAFEGDFIIRSALGTVLDLPGGKASPIILWGHHGRNNQVWRFVRCADGSFMIQSLGVGGLVIDVPSSQTLPGLPLIAYAPRGGINQQWRIEPVPERAGAYFLRSALNGFAIDVLGGNASPGTNAVHFPFHGGDNQVWFLERLSLPTPGSDVIIRSALGPVLDLTGGTTPPGTLIVWPHHGRLNQVWRYLPNRDGTFTIESRADGALVIDVPNSTTSPAAPIIAFPSHGGPNQHWLFEPAPLRAGAFVIRSALPGGLALDIAGGGKKPGTRVIQFRPHGGDNQAWYFDVVRAPDAVAVSFAAAAHLTVLSTQAPAPLAPAVIIETVAECPICFTATSPRVAFNCGHIVCAVCAPALATCPICRADVTARIQLFE